MVTDKANPNDTQPSKEDPEWRDHYNIGAVDGSNAVLECAHCAKGGEKRWCTTSTRARGHQSDEVKGVAACKKVPEAIRCLFKTASVSTVAAKTLVHLCLTTHKHRNHDEEEKTHIFRLVLVGLPARARK